MLRTSFCFIPGIGEKTEQDLWRQGILSWDDLADAAFLRNLSLPRNRAISRYLRDADQALIKHDSGFFAHNLPQREYWRAYKEFQNRTVFLDIETTGLSLYYDHISLIGCFDGERFRTFIRGSNLEEVTDYLREFEVIVTFNGRIFDIPFIKKTFPSVRVPPIHVDLRFLLRSLSITGPLKEVEKELQIQRDKESQEINGKEAALLWRRFRRGDDGSLEKLVLYNLFDTKNLQDIMHYCYKRKVTDRVIPCLQQPNAQQLLFDLRDSQSIVAEIPDSPLDMPVISTRRSNGRLSVRLNGNVIHRLNVKDISKLPVNVQDLLQRMAELNEKPLVVGIDLSGSKKRGSGICILRNEEAHLAVRSTDEEILEIVREQEHCLVSIDSPLGLPENRCCGEDTCDCRQYGIMRKCERVLKKRGINVYPCLIPSMRTLTLRGIRLARTLREDGYDVIESYPGAAQDILAMPRKRVSLEELKYALTDMGITVQGEREKITHDEIDALTSALVGFFYLARMYEAIGEASEGYLVIPEIPLSTSM